jgi:hypothetical protein
MIPATLGSVAHYLYGAKVIIFSELRPSGALKGVKGANTFPEEGKNEYLCTNH